MPSFDDLKAPVQTFNKEWSKYHSELCTRGKGVGAAVGRNAGLAVGMAEQGTIEAGIALGLRAGAFAVTQVGVIGGLATRSQLDETFPE